MNLLRNITFSFWHDWDSFSFRPMNWRDFTVIYLCFETNSYSRYLDISFAILGFHFDFSIYRDYEKAKKEVDKFFNQED